MSRRKLLESLDKGFKWPPSGQKDHHYELDMIFEIYNFKRSYHEVNYVMEHQIRIYDILKKVKMSRAERYSHVIWIYDIMDFEIFLYRKQ